VLLCVRHRRCGRCLRRHCCCRCCFLCCLQQPPMDLRKSRSRAMPQAALRAPTSRSLSCGGAELVAFLPQLATSRSFRISVGVGGQASTVPVHNGNTHQLADGSGASPQQPRRKQGKSPTLGSHHHCYSCAIDSCPYCSFDDEVSAESTKLVLQLSTARKNPNGCRVPLTW